MLKPEKNKAILISALGAVLLFLCARAEMLHMTHDEAYSFFNIKKFWHVQFLCNANSHWINSLAMKISVLLGGENPVELRWFSLVSAAGFFFSAFFLINNLNGAILKAFAFSIIILNPFVLDYFILARGYASGLFFESVSILLFIANLNKGKKYFLHWSLICAGLSAIANFNFFYFFAAFSLIFFYWEYFRNGLAFAKNKWFYFHLLTAVGFALVVLRALLFIKRCSNDFGLGTENFTEMFWSYFDGLHYIGNHLKINTLQILGVLLASVSFISSATGILYYKKHGNKIYTLSSGIFLLVMTAIIFNRVMFGVLYPYYRSALPLFPLIAVNSIFFLDFVLKSNLTRTIVFTSLTPYFSLLFIRGINFSYTFDFYHQCNSKESFDLLEKLNAKKIAMSHEHWGVYINYYHESKNYNYGFKAERLNTYEINPDKQQDRKLQNYEYLILYPPYDLSYYEKARIHFTAVKIFDVSKTIILKVEPF